MVNYFFQMDVLDLSMTNIFRTRFSHFARQNNRNPELHISYMRQEEGIITIVKKTCKKTICIQ